MVSRTKIRSGWTNADIVTDDALLRWQKVQALKRPTKRSQRNVYNLISNTGSLVQDESDWIHEGPDLAALGYGGDHGWLNAMLEDFLNLISRAMTKVSLQGIFGIISLYTLLDRILSGDISVQTLKIITDSSGPQCLC